LRILAAILDVIGHQPFGATLDGRQIDSSIAKREQAGAEATGDGFIERINCGTGKGVEVLATVGGIRCDASAKARFGRNLHSRIIGGHTSSTGVFVKMVKNGHRRK